MRHTKQKILLLAMIICCIAIAAVGTLAYFSDQTKAHNVITSGNIKIELREWADKVNGIPFSDQTGVMPGTAVPKWVEVENTGEASAWVRVKVNVTVTAPAATTIGGVIIDTPVNPPINGNGDAADDAPATILESCVTLDYNTAYWTYNEADGYWYYTTALPVGATTEPLFTTVTFDAAMENEYQGANVAIDVDAYAVQSANNGATAQTAAGWPTAE